MVLRPVDTQKPTTRIQKWTLATYARCEQRHESAAHICNNERYNNEARLINAQRCRGLEWGNWETPPNGLIRLIEPITGHAYTEAPRWIQHFDDIQPRNLHAISELYGFRWIVPRPGDVPAGVPTPTLEMMDDYCAHVGAADFY